MKWITLFVAVLLSMSALADKQQKVDSLLSIVNNSQAQDTLRAKLNITLSELLGVASLDTLVYFSNAAIQIANKGLESDPIRVVKRSLLLSKVTATNNLGYVHLMLGEVDQALKLYNDVKIIAQTLGNKDQLSTYYVSVGYIYENRGEILKALEFYLKGLNLKRELGDKKGQATSLNNIAQIYEHQGDIQRAIEHYDQSLKLFEEVQNPAGQAALLNNLAVLYYDQGDEDLSIEYLHKSYDLRVEIGDQRGIAQSLNNIGMTIGRTGRNTEALTYFEKSLKIRRKIKDPMGEASSYGNIGSMHLKLGDTARCLEFFHLGLELSAEIQFARGEANSLNKIGDIYFQIGNLERSKFYAEQAMALALKMEFPSHIKDAARMLNKIAKIEGNYKKALEMFELHIQMRDSIKNDETQKATIRQQTKYEFEKAQLVKEQEEKEAARLVDEATSRRDNLQYSVILIALLVIGGLLSVIGRFSMPIQVVEGLIFFSFLILFEFLLVLADPFIEGWSGGAPGIKLLFNAGIAALIFPAHAFFESKMKGRLVKK